LSYGGMHLDYTERVRGVNADRPQSFWRHEPAGRGDGSVRAVRRMHGPFDRPRPRMTSQVRCARVRHHGAPSSARGRRPPSPPLRRMHPPNRRILDPRRTCASTRRTRGGASMEPSPEPPERERWRQLSAAGARRREFDSRLQARVRCILGVLPYHGSMSAGRRRLCALRCTVRMARPCRGGGR